MAKGLTSQELFKAQEDKKAIRQLVSLYNNNATLPDVNFTALIKRCIASLPETLTSFELYNEIQNARTIINLMRNIFKKLSAVKYMTLELVTPLLLHVSKKSPLNKLDTRSLVMEMARHYVTERPRMREL